MIRWIYIIICLTFQCDRLFVLHLLHYGQRILVSGWRGDLLRFCWFEYPDAADVNDKYKMIKTRLNFSPLFHSFCKSLANGLRKCKMHVRNCRFPRLKNIAKDFLRFLRFWKHLISSTVKEIQDIFGAFLPKIGTPRWKLYSHSVSKSHNWIDVGALYLRSQESQCE